MTKGLIYTAVFKANVILVEFARATGTYYETAKHILALLPSSDARKSFTHQQYTHTGSFPSLIHQDLYFIAWSRVVQYS